MKILPYASPSRKWKVCLTRTGGGPWPGRSTGTTTWRRARRRCFISRFRGLGGNRQNTYQTISDIIGVFEVLQGEANRPTASIVGKTTVDLGMLACGLSCVDGAYRLSDDFCREKGVLHVAIGTVTEEEASLPPRHRRRRCNCHRTRARTRPTPSPGNGSTSAERGFASTSPRAGSGGWGGSS